MILPSSKLNFVCMFMFFLLLTSEQVEMTSTTGGRVSTKRAEVREDHGRLEGRSTFDLVRTTGSNRESPRVGGSESVLCGNSTAATV